MKESSTSDLEHEYPIDTNEISHSMENDVSSNSFNQLITYSGTETAVAEKTETFVSKARSRISRFNNKSKSRRLLRNDNEKSQRRNGNRYRLVRNVINSEKQSDPPKNEENLETIVRIHNEDEHLTSLLKMSNILQSILCSLSQMSTWLTENISDQDIIQENLEALTSKLMVQLRSISGFGSINKQNAIASQQLIKELQNLFIEIINWLAENKLDLDEIYKKLSSQIRTFLTELRKISNFDDTELCEFIKNVLEAIVKFTKWIENNKLNLKSILDKLAPKLFEFISYLERITTNTIPLTQNHLTSLNLLTNDVIKTLSLFISWIEYPGNKNFNNNNQLSYFKNLIIDIQSLLPESISSVINNDLNSNEMIANLKYKAITLLENLKWASNIANLNPIYSNASKKLLGEIQYLLLYTIDLINTNKCSPNLDVVLDELKPRLLSMLGHLKHLLDTIKLRPNDFNNLKIFSVDVFNSILNIVDWLSNNHSKLDEIVKNLYKMFNSLFPQLNAISETYKKCPNQSTDLDNLLQHILNYLLQFLDWLNDYYTDYDNIKEHSNPKVSILLNQLKWISKTSHLNKAHLPLLQNVIQNIISWISQVMSLLSKNDSNVNNVMRQLNFSYQK